MTAFGRLLAAHADRRAPGPEGAVLLAGPVPAAALVVAAGLHPVQLVPDPGAPTPRLDALAGDVALTARDRSVVEQVLARTGTVAGVLTTGRTPADAGLFAVLRELGRTTGTPLPPLAHLDAPGLDRPPSAAYRAAREAEVLRWLGELAGRPVDRRALAAAEELVAARDAVLGELTRERLSASPRTTGWAAAVARQAGAAIGPAAHLELLRALVGDGFAGVPRPGSPDRRVVLAGSAQDDAALVAAVEERGLVVLDATDGAELGWSATGPGRPGDELVDLLLREARERSATVVVHASRDEDEVARWDAARLVARAPADLEVVVVRGGAGELDAPRPVARPVGGARTAPAQGPRSRKVLTVAESYTAHQREWFAEVTGRARDGEPFAVVGADYPHELLRALDVPYVVTQWWASIVGSKRMTAGNLAALAAAGYALDVEPYSAQGLASHLADEAPWGGLPRPAVLGAALGTPVTHRLYTAWAAETGARYLPVERTAESRARLSPTWWADLPAHWDDAVEAPRLDLLRAELDGVVAGLEQVTGRRLDHGRLAEVLELANEQAVANREARDLLAAARPAPAGVVDTMPATMVPQWHRGTVWARDAARALRDELATRVAAGQGVVDDERLRLMWVGRGMWGDTGLYQHLEASHGAVFVWSMYLGLAADGYERRCGPGQDPLRALASRFVVMGDELRMPGWAGPWHVEEARRHGVDAAVAIADADPFVVRALEDAGVPVLRLGLDNTAHDAGAAARARLEEFVDGLVGARAGR